MHEVVVTKRTRSAIELASDHNRSLWRVSSTVSESSCIIIVYLILRASGSSFHTECGGSKFLFHWMQLFSHIASDAVLKPLGHFAESPHANKYPPMLAGEYVEKELAVINLKGKKGEHL